MSGGSVKAGVHELLPHPEISSPDPTPFSSCPYPLSFLPVSLRIRKETANEKVKSHRSTNIQCIKVMLPEPLVEQFAESFSTFQALHLCNKI